MIQKQSVGFFYLASTQNRFYLLLRTGLATKNLYLFLFYLPLRVDSCYLLLRVDSSKKIAISTNYLPLRVDSSIKTAKQDLSFKSSIWPQQMVAHLLRSSQHSVARLLKLIENLKRKIPGFVDPFHCSNLSCQPLRINNGTLAIDSSNLPCLSLRTENWTFAICLDSGCRSLRINSQNQGGIEFSVLFRTARHSVARLSSAFQLSVARLLEELQHLVAHLLKQPASSLRANPRSGLSPALPEPLRLPLRTDETARLGIGLKSNLTALIPLAKNHYRVPEKNLPNLLGPPLCWYCYQQLFMYMKTKTSYANYAQILLLKRVRCEIGRAHV